MVDDGSHLRSTGAQRFATILAAAGLVGRVRELPESTRTAEEAARAIGCAVEQIVKSIVFRGRETGQAYLVLLSGGDRVDERLLASCLGEPVVRADPKFVRRATGFAIGGVPPFGRQQPIDTFIDDRLLQFDCLWAAAGSPHAVFPVHPDELVMLSRGRLVRVRCDE